MSEQQLISGIHIDPTTGEAVPNHPRPVSLAPASGSLPVSSAEILRVAVRHENMAKDRRSAAEMMWEEDDPTGQFRAGHRRLAEVFSEVAAILRRHAASMIERQPEENDQDEKRDE